MGGQLLQVGSGHVTIKKKKKKKNIIPNRDVNWWDMVSSAKDVRTQFQLDLIEYAGQNNP